MHRVRAILNRPDPAKWIFYGDSITHGARHTFGKRDYTQIFAERLRAEMPRPWDVILNTAISGNTTRELLATFDWRVGQFQPDVVFLMIGMNDCNPDKQLSIDEFRGNLNALVDKIGEAGALAVLQTSNPILPGALPEREQRLADYMDVLRQVAGDRQTPLIDHFDHWRQCADRMSFWMSDKNHPNAFGHIEFAHRIFRELEIYDPAATTCRLFTP